MNENKKKLSARIELRVTVREKEKIQSKARKCGLSTTEYVKQRALGYEPRVVSPDALFVCLEKLGELADKASSPELDEEIRTVLKQITAEFLLPRKGCQSGSPQSKSLCGEKEHPHKNEPFAACGESEGKERDATWLLQASGRYTKI